MISVFNSIKNVMIKFKENNFDSGAVYLPLIIFSINLLATHFDSKSDIWPVLDSQKISPSNIDVWQKLNKPEILKSYKLLKNKKELKARDDTGSTLLIYTAWFGYMGGVEALIKNGLSLNDKNKYGISAYNIIKRYYPEMLKSLTDLEVSVKEKNKEESSWITSKL